jgi:hypothetical protein
MRQRHVFLLIERLSECNGRLSRGLEGHHLDALTEAAIA